MSANSKIITRRIGLFAYQLAGRPAGYSRLINNGKGQTLETKRYTLKNYERLSLQDQIIVRNRLKYSNYTPPKVEKMTERVEEESKRLDQNIDTIESDTNGVDRGKC
jgi:predicted P-loop ATPase/GTPase